MSSPYSSFVLERRFFPLFWVQFLGAFNDNVFKNALVMMVTFKIVETASQVGLLVTLAAGLFIFPFFLFSAFAGIVADSFDKTKLIKIIKFTEVLIMLLAAWALMAENLVLLFVVLFLMGLQSTFFGPIKYSILPEHLSSDELLHGNGWFSASTFLAILLGTLVGGILVLADNGIATLSIVLIALSLLGLLASFWVPASQEVQNKPKFSWNIFRLTQTEVSHCRQYPQAFFAILAISWFWFLGATYLSQMPVMVKELIGAEDKVLILFLAVFSIGIGVGAVIVSLLNVKVRSVKEVLKNGIYLLLISVIMWLSNLLMYDMLARETPLLLAEFLTEWKPLLVLVLLGIIATLGGIFIVPLYTLLQVKTPAGSRSRTVAVNNITNAVLMVLSAVLIMGMYALDWSLLRILFAVSLMNVLAVVWYFKAGQKLT